MPSLFDFDSHSGPDLVCPVDGCPRQFLSQTTWTRHLREMHPDWVDPDMPPLIDSDSDAGSDDFDVNAGLDDFDMNADEEYRHTDEDAWSTAVQDLDPPSLARGLLSDSDETESLPDLTELDNKDEYELDSEGDGDGDESATSSDSENLAMNIDIGIGLQELVRDLLGEASSSEDGSAHSNDEAAEMSPERRPAVGAPAGSSATSAATDKYHDHITGLPCDEQGNFLKAGEAPAARPTSGDWAPYKDRLQYEVADLLYTQEQMSGANIDKLLELWNASLLPHNTTPPFRNHFDMYQTIDATPLGEVSWTRFVMSHPDADSCPADAPTWKKASYEVWYRDVREVVKNIISNLDFKTQIDYAPLREFDTNGVRQLRNFKGGDWAWRQADEIAKDPNTHGAAFVPIILGSDKTTVSVATGQNEYYPLYASIGNIHNTARRAHRNGVVLVGFLAIPKTSRKYADDVQYRKFRRQLFHSSLSRILQSLKPGMTTPEVVHCGDGHFRKVIYGLGPYIADYPEQALLACIVQGWCPIPGAALRSREHTETVVCTHELGELWDEYGIVGDVIPFTNDFPRADIHELLSPDILHQLIKGSFKDHLITWIELYLTKTLGKAQVLTIISDIDRWIAIVPLFPGLRRFPQGHKLWYS
ncbi:hypothetical protein LXA43DRAFT_1069135 [Ganoderma leucocontextum]|nr:hypothetical protein LXA43DRAFT_1069135 [Ganoderma leucocontextum]